MGSVRGHLVLARGMLVAVDLAPSRLFEPNKRVNIMNFSRIGVSCCVLALGAACSPSQESPINEIEQQVSVAVDMTLITVDADGPEEPWGKSVGDLDGDGHLDLLVQGHAGGGLVWYRNPDLERFEIASGSGFRTDAEVADVDGDGRNDVVTITDSGMRWYRAPTDPTQSGWSSIAIVDTPLHDVEVGDFGGSPALDTVGRNQTPFADDGDFLEINVQSSPSSWSSFRLPAPHGEGLMAVDVNGDGALDLVVNGIWYENDGDPSDGYPEHTYASNVEPNAALAYGDINGDGRSDIVVAPSEGSGTAHEIAWYEAPVDRTQLWVEHIVASGVEGLYHSAGVGDFDGDSRLDIVTAEMPQSAGDDEVVVFRNTTEGWKKDLVDRNGSHSMRVLDFDQDGDPDVFGANWSAQGRDTNVKLWRNDTVRQALPLDSWRLHVIDSMKPEASVFAFPADLDADGFPDIVTGDRWYRNPGRIGDTWAASVFEDPAENALIAHDFDDDGDLDVLSSQAVGQGSDGGFSWLRNDGGNFAAFSNIEESPSGDFLQGVAVVEGRVALSWHEPGLGLDVLSIPSNPESGTWSLESLSEVSEDEALSVGDIDGDGDDDLFLGSQWLENNGGSWSPHQAISDSAGLPPDPDRNRLADVDGDGDLDAIVGFEGESVPLVWLEAPSDPTRTWDVHAISSNVGGGYSLDVGDVDDDGDPDVILGEHRGATRLLLFENDAGSWPEHVIHEGGAGFDHHDGSRLVDLDQDGDLDVVSIGWFPPSNVWVWENLAVTDGSPPPPPPEDPPAPGDLVGHWGFDEGLGIDSSPSAYDGTISGATPVSGRAGDALSFDGADDYVSLPTFDVEGEALTIAAWIRAEGFQSPHMDNRILSKATSTAGDDHYFMLSGINHEGQPHLRFRLKTQGNTSTLVGTGAPLSLGQWHHVSAVYDGTEMRLYLDGELVGRVAKTGAIDRDGSVPVNIGRNPDGYGTFDGALDDVRIYSAALSHAQIQDLMDPSSTPSNLEPEAALTAQPPRGEAPLSVAFDASNSSDDDGTISSYVWDFGDGTSDTGALVSHDYQASGVFDVTVTVTDDDGATDVASTSVTVDAPPQEQPPTAGFTISCSAEMNSTSSDADGSIMTSSWNVNGVDVGSGTSLTRLFDSPGAHSIRLTVTDDDGNQSEVTRTVTIE